MVSEFSYSVNIFPDKYHPDLRIFVCDSDHEIIAHRAVLASHSHFLKTAFLSSNVEEENTLILPDFSFEDVTLMVQLLYGQISEIKVPSEIFSVLRLDPSYKDPNSNMNTEDNALVLESLESKRKVVDSFKKSRGKPKVFTDATANLAPDSDNDGSVVNIDVEAYILQDSTDVRPWVCRICLNANEEKPVKHPYRSMQKHNLHYHIIRKHFNMQIPKNWKCDLCAKKFISRSGLRQHKRDKCPMSVQSVPSYPESRTPTPYEEPESDSESVAGGGVQMFKCATCCNIFESIEEINQHLQICNQEDQVMYQCNDCWEAGQEFIFPTMSQLNNHIDREHSDVVRTSLPQSNLATYTFDQNKAYVVGDFRETTSSSRSEDGSEFKKNLDIINAEVIIEEIDDDEENNVMAGNNINQSVLVEGVVENESHVLFDDYENQSVEDPDIDTNEVLIQCESSDFHDNNSNEVSLVAVDENENPVFCPVCNNGFSSPEVLAEHLTYHPACPTCGEMVLNQTLLDQHLSTHHLCGICGDRFIDLHMLEKHEKTHADIEEAMSKESSIVGLKYQNPEIRDAISSIQSFPVITSKECLERRKSPQLIHEALLDGADQKINDGPDLDIASMLVQQNIRAQCDLCEENFSSGEVLDMHVKGAHSGFVQQSPEPSQFRLHVLDTLNCNFCPEKFNSVEQLNTHTAVAHREVLEAVQMASASDFYQNNSQNQIAVRESFHPFNCTLCKDSFAKVYQLSKHISNNHMMNKLESGKPFTCNICSCNFLQLSTLEKHVSVQHTGQDHEYVCPECSKPFKFSSGLQSHLRIHGSVRLYQCGACSRTFNWEASIRTHMKKCTGEPVKEHIPKRKLTRTPEVNIEVDLGVDYLMTVKCSRCGETFGDEEQFSDHTCPGHMGRGRRYRCNRCNVLFKSRKMIRRHLRSCVTDFNNVDSMVAEKRKSKRARRVVEDEIFVTDLGSDKELEDLVDSDAEEEFKLNAKDVSDSSDGSVGSSADEEDDFTIEPSSNRTKLENNEKVTMSSVEIKDDSKPSKLERNFPCEFCDKVFMRSHHLKEHKMAHTNEYPFSCSKCNKGFRRRLQQERHKCSDPVKRMSMAPNTEIGVDKTFSITDRDWESKSELALDENSSSAACLFNCNICKFSTNDGESLNDHLLSEDHIEKVALEEFNSSSAKYKCELCLFTAGTEYKFKRHTVTKKHIENTAILTEEELQKKLNKPEIHSSLICDESFKDMDVLDNHVENDNKDETFSTSRSGRKIKAKKFYDDSSVGKNRIGIGGKRERARKTKQSEGPDLNTSQESLSGPSVDCGICGESFTAITDQFVHMLSHVPHEIVKSLPVADGEGVGWCPHCPGPVRLEEVEQHMLDLHHDMNEDESSTGLKVGFKKLEFDEIDPEDLDSLELAETDRCVPKRLPG